MCRITGLFVLSSSDSAGDKSAGRFSRTIHTRERYPYSLAGSGLSPFLFSLVASRAAAAAAATHTLRSIYLKQMLSDAAPLCGGKMRPSSIPSALSLLFLPPFFRARCSFPLSLSLPPSAFTCVFVCVCVYMYSPLFACSPGSSPPLFSFGSPVSLKQGCFLRVPSASCSLHPTHPHAHDRSRFFFPCRRNRAVREKFELPIRFWKCLFDSFEV